MLEVKFTDLGIEIRVKEDIERGFTPDQVDAAYPPGDPRRYPASLAAHNTGSQEETGR